MIGIYKITTLHNNKIYIGSSASNIKNRIYSHISLLKRNKHHSPYLQHVYNKYGKSNLEFSIIEELFCKDKSFIIEREQYWLDKLKPYYPKNGYNVAIVAQCNFKDYSKIKQYDLSGNYIKTWDCAKDLAEDLKVTVSSIYAVCNRAELISIKNYQLRYVKDTRPVENKLFLLSCYDIEGNLLKCFSGYKEAALYYGIRLYSNIRRAAMDNTKCNNMYWKIYNTLEVPKKIETSIKKARGKKIDQFTKEAVFVKRFNSVTEAADSVGSSVFALSKVLSCKRYSPKTLKGYKWKYV